MNPVTLKSNNIRHSWHDHVCDLCIRRVLEHLGEEGVDGHVAYEPEEEEVFETLEADGPKGGQTKEQLSEPAWFVRVGGSSVFFQYCVHLLSEDLYFLDWFQSTYIYNKISIIKFFITNLFIFCLFNALISDQKMSLWNFIMIYLEVKIQFLKYNLFVLYRRKRLYADLKK